jgi:protein-tyrosine phosphatase/membrane-associated phospholipid phosphatase
VTLGSAARASIGLSVFFLVVYGACNWLTAQRADVGTWYFEWERRIPFLAFMILPYMSIDLFFVAGPFLCESREELRTLTRRIVMAIAAAAAGFLLLPLRFAFERPAAAGWLGAIFDGFRVLDQPHNLVPSLHITLLAILTDLYGRHTTGLLRAGLLVWFGLVGFSAVFTYQHHVIDVVGGFALAVVCFWAVPKTASAAPVVPNPRVGSRYLAGALIVGLLALAGWRWTAPLLWPAASLAIVGIAYFGVGPGIFRKAGGRLPLSTRVLLGPCLVGQHLSLLYYRRQCRRWDEVAPGVLIGRWLSDVEAAAAVRAGVTAVLDLTAEFSEASPFLRLPYRNVAILDLTAPTPEQLGVAVAFIARHATTGTVYVHCKIGYSRSAAAVGAHLLAAGQAGTVGDVEARLRRVRPSIVIRPEVMDALRRYAGAQS